MPVQPIACCFELLRHRSFSGAVRLAWPVTPHRSDPGVARRKLLLAALGMTVLIPNEMSVFETRFVTFFVLGGQVVARVDAKATITPCEAFQERIFESARGAKHTRWTSCQGCPDGGWDPEIGRCGRFGRLWAALKANNASSIVPNRSREVR